MAKMFRKSECGKGDNRREAQVSQETYNDNWEKTFGTKKDQTIDREAQGDVPSGDETEGPGGDAGEASAGSD